jgi:hypothetical protein
MSIIKTDTPTYRGQKPNTEPERGICERLVSLLRTETPRYRRPPVIGRDGDRGDRGDRRRGDCGDRAGCAARRDE